MSVDWDKMPSDLNTTTNVMINFSTPCRKFSKYAYHEPIIVAPVLVNTIPDNFTKGFVESDGHVTLEGPHYQSIEQPKQAAANSSGKAHYHTFENYGRTMTTPPTGQLG